MKRSLIAMLLLVCSYKGFSQGGDSLVQYRMLEASLTESSAKNKDNKHFEYLPIRMAKGDVVYIKYSSKDYIVALAVQDSMGHVSMKEDNPLMFQTLGSEVAIPFKAEETGKYAFIFLSKEANKTGKFKAELLYYNKRNERVSNYSPFCDKLKHITGLAYTGFQFLMGAEKKTYLGKSHEATVSLLPDATNEVYSNVGDYYRCTYASTTNLDELKTKFDDLESKIGSCLTDHVKKVYTAETVAEFEKKDFVRKVEFKLAGGHPHDINPNHGLANEQDKVTLRLQKSGNDKYILRLEIE